MKNPTNKDIHATLLSIKSTLQELQKQFPRRPYNLASMIYTRAAEESLEYFYEKASNALIIEDRFKVLEYSLNRCMNNPLSKNGLFLDKGCMKVKVLIFVPT